ncbi:hypothetical protein [Hyphomonas oceanitis]|uniref:hypothetical protein n=1 Tax=Hyphomonas oceanitis TaxID=81033 RepID=UPI0030018760
MSLPLNEVHALDTLESAMLTAPEHIRQHTLIEVVKKLDVQKDLIFTADQRALRFVTFGVGMCAFYAAALAALSELHIKDAMSGAVAGIIVALIGVMLSAWVGRPSQNCFLPGTKPREFVDDAKSKPDEIAFTSSVIRWNQYYVDQNDLIIRRDNRTALAGAACIIVSPFIAILVSLTSRTFG